MSRLLIGVDEAGRGSLVGELVIVAIAVPPADADRLRELGVRDSKELSPSARSELYRFLLRYPFQAISISPKEIDAENINILEEEYIAMTLSALAKRLGSAFSTSRIVVDKFGRVRRLHEALRSIGFEGELIVVEKADRDYVEVAAASIIAKHLRDRRIAVLRSLYGLRGSGYPADAETIEWLKDILAKGERPSIIRYSWATLKSLGIEVARKGRKSGRTLDEYLRYEP